jgi:hypothetical protein
VRSRRSHIHLIDNRHASNMPTSSSSSCGSHHCLAATCGYAM